MPAAVLQLGCTIQCPHGGTVTAVTANAHVKVGGAFALLSTDTFTVAGCPFILGLVPHPCVLVRWTLPALRVKVNGTPVLLASSVGLCVAADQAPQGAAVVSGVQTKVKGT
ncbi:MAG: hypothetical protein U0835_17485 [Isosphaeraceae bacterium]